MIELLGVKRAIFLGTLLAINLIIVAILFFYIVPVKEQADAELTTSKGEISRLQSGIQNIKSELQSLKETMPQFDALAAKGFFNDQDRFFISRTLEELKKQSQLYGFSFTVDNLREIVSADAATANRRLVASRIQIERVASLLDTSFFDFISRVETGFPTHARIKSFQLKKAAQLNEAVLKNISTSPVSLIDAGLTMDWLTMTEIPPPVIPGVGGP